MSQTQELTDTAGPAPDDRRTGAAAALGADALARTLDETLAAYRTNAGDNPLENPAQRLALGLSSRLGRGDLDRPTLDALVHLLTPRAFEYRAGRLRSYIGQIDPAENDAAIRALFEAQTLGADGAPIPFDAFRVKVERVVVGIVFTAHPTFGMTPDLAADLGLLAAGRTAEGAPLDDAARDEILTRARSLRHGSPPGISLETEEAEAEAAIVNAQQALARITGILLDVAAAAYPDD